MSRLTDRLRLHYLIAIPARALDRFVEWMFVSRNPVVIYVGEAIRRQGFLLFVGRAVIRSAWALSTLPRRLRERLSRFSPNYAPMMEIAAARAVGGGVTIPELLSIWEARRWRARVLYIAEGLEREQIEMFVLSARMRPVAFCAPTGNRVGDIDPNDFHMVIAAPVRGIEPEIDHLRKKFRTPERWFCVAESSKRSAYSGWDIASQMPRPSSSVRPSIREKLARNEPLRVVFLNDVGFQFGAGIALKRQVASLLLKGWEVSVVAWAPGKVLDPPRVTGIKHFETWQGIHSLFVKNANSANSGVTSDQMIASLTAKIQSLDPDLVITGNLHGAPWPLTLLTKLQSLGIRVVAYMHDTYFVTGRCAQPLACTLYQSGCDQRCPTSHEYPRLAPEKIAPAWRERSRIFAADRIALVGNSRWTRDIALNRFGDRATIEMVNLGLDHELFAPVQKSLARRLLGVSDDKPIVVMGAVDVHNQWKGGPLFHGLHAALAERDDVNIILFGQSSETLKSQKSLGLVRDERVMPLVMNAADIFVSTATAESFGQSLLEASACGLPVVAFNVGGVSDVVCHNDTGVLVEHAAVASLLAAVDRLVDNRLEREAMGRNGRARVENNFTLFHQANAWVDCLQRIC